MSTGVWLCKRCFELDDSALELHIEAHARTSVWPLPEIRQTIYHLREVAQHCPDCKSRVMADIIDRDRFERARVQLRDAGLLKEDPPTDPKARAMWDKQQRGTGPAQPSAQDARRPRRHR